MTDGVGGNNCYLCSLIDRRGFVIDEEQQMNYGATNPAVLNPPLEQPQSTDKVPKKPLDVHSEP
jgi:hypothetical protein